MSITKRKHDLRPTLSPSAAAVSQSSMLEVATSLLLGWANPALLAVGGSVGVALFINHRRERGGSTNQETTGWVFLPASAPSAPSCCVTGWCCGSTRLALTAIIAK